MFGEIIKARKGELLDALQKGEIKVLGLDSPQSGATDRDDWIVSTSVAFLDGLFYLGGETTIFSSPSALLRRAWEIATELLDVRYGIAYQLPQDAHPGMYAMGTKTYTLSEIKRDMDFFSNETTLNSWHNEMWGPRRYLTGMFRGAYPASVLSESHIRRAGLMSGKVGTLSRLDSRLWCWELSDSEIPKATQVLEESGALI